MENKSQMTMINISTDTKAAYDNYCKDNMVNKKNGLKKIMIEKGYMNEKGELKCSTK